MRCHRKRDSRSKSSSGPAGIPASARRLQGSLLLQQHAGAAGVPAAYAIRGCLANGRGRGWEGVTHSRIGGDGGVRGGGLCLNCAAARGNWRGSSGSGGGGGGGGADGIGGGRGAASTIAASASHAPTLCGRSCFCQEAAIGVRPTTAVGAAHNPFKPPLLLISEVGSTRRLPEAGSRSFPDAPPRAHGARPRLSAAVGRLGRLSLGSPPAQGCL